MTNFREKISKLFFYSLENETTFSEKLEKIWKKMKDSKQVRSEYQSFVESYSSISQQSLEEAYKEKESKKSAKKEEDCECQHEMVLMRKSGAFTELAEKYQMGVKQFARFVENNQGLFDIETRKKAILANKFSGSLVNDSSVAKSAPSLTSPI